MALAFGIPINKDVVLLALGRRAIRITQLTRRSFFAKDR